MQDYNQNLSAVLFPRWWTKFWTLLWHCRETFFMPFRPEGKRTWQLALGFSGKLWWPISDSCPHSSLLAGCWSCRGINLLYSKALCINLDYQWGKNLHKSSFGAVLVSFGNGPNLADGNPACEEVKAALPGLQGIWSLSWKKNLKMSLQG